MFGVYQVYAFGLHLTGICSVPPTCLVVYLSNVFGKCPEATTVHSRSPTTLFLRRHSMHIHRAVAVKSIRLTEGLGGKDYDASGLKVLHLVRDPRAVVRSQQAHLRTSWGRRGRVKADNRKTSRAGGVRCEVKPLSADDNRLL